MNGKGCLIADFSYNLKKKVTSELIMETNANIEGTANHVTVKIVYRTYEFFITVRHEGVSLGDRGS